MGERERAIFEDCLDRVGDAHLKQELGDLIRTIQREGERLGHFRSLPQLELYKKKVQEFVAKANRGTFKVKASSFTDAAGDYSSQLIVEKVDAALESLTKLVMDKESQAIQILEKVGLIKGLLADLYQ